MTCDPAPHFEGNPEEANPGSTPRFELIERVAWREDREVWRARQIWPPRQIALKLSHDLPQLRREAAALVRVGPPTVPEVIEVGEIALHGYPEPVPGLAAEWVEGLPIDSATLSLPLPERLDRFARLCDAVEQIHEAGLIHGDIKPLNVRVDWNGEVRVLDLGDVRPRGKKFATEEFATGSLAYSAPERLRGESATESSDVYSLGVILYDLLAGARPWRTQEADGPHALRRAILRSDPPSPRRVAPWVSPAMEAIVLQALASHPGRRYSTARAIGEEIRRALRGERVHARRPAANSRLWDFLRHHPRQTLAVGSLILALLAAITISVGGAMAAHSAERRADKLRGPVEQVTTVLLDQVERFARLGGTLATRQKWIALAERTLARPDFAENRGEIRAIDARLHRLLGELIDEEDHHELAIEHFERARDIYEALYEREPGPEYGGCLSICRVRIGDLAFQSGDEELTAECYGFAFQLDRDLHEEYPDDMTLYDDLGYSHERIGSFALKHGDVHEAGEHFRERLKIATEVFQIETTPHRAFALLQSESLLAEFAGKTLHPSWQLECLWRSHDWGEWILVATPNDRKVVRRHISTCLAVASVRQKLSQDPSYSESRTSPTIGELLSDARTLAEVVVAADGHDPAVHRLKESVEHAWEQFQKRSAEDRDDRFDGSGKESP